MCANNNHRLSVTGDPSLEIKRRVLSFSFYSVVIEHNNRFKCSAIDTVRFIGRVPGRMDGQSKWTGKDSVDDLLTALLITRTGAVWVSVVPGHT